MNLQEQTNRIKQMMGIINEVVDVNDDSYVSMNIKNFPRYKKEVAELLKDKLNFTDTIHVTDSSNFFVANEIYYHLKNQALLCNK
jgi:hypothetical protein